VSSIVNEYYTIKYTKYHVKYYNYAKPYHYYYYAKTYANML